ncbi:DUF2288 domain-containing protein [Marichromatium sp. PS1]|uniref:DUF2288 domain-containing protein n=1 Tax=Marichromatium sp. PS1 TaxID=3138932 RepID=UPI0032E5C999
MTQQDPAVVDGTPLEQDDALLRAKLNQETARAPWSSLQRFFAQGKVIRVAVGLDLIETALRIARDDTAALGAAIEAGEVGPIPDAEARDWFARDTEVWALVIAPWVLVQETGCTSGSTPTPVHG